MTDKYLIDKRLVRRAFDHAAQTYDAAAVLQHEVAGRMAERLSYIRHTPEHILDAGSGTGNGLPYLRERFPKATITALDIAWNMLAVNRAKQPWWKRKLASLGGPSLHYACGDLDALPLKTSSVGMIWSNLTIQWCNDLEVTFREMHRTLAPGGLLMFSTFGPDTLKELRAVFSGLDGYTHVNRFIDMHDIGDALVHAGFATPVMDMEHITLTYSDMMTLLRELKDIGAHNVTQGRRPGMMGRAELAALTDGYERFRKDGRLPATFEIVYGHAWVNQKNRTEDGRQIIQFQIERRRSRNTGGMGGPE